MFKEFFFLELKSAFKRPMVYVFFFIMGIIGFAAVASDNVSVGGSVGNLYKNAPFVITLFVSRLSLFAILFAVAFFNNAALRDYNNQFHEILFSTPLSKSGYFFGRFFGALVLATIPLTGIFLGFLLGAAVGPAVGWIDADRIGEFYLSTFTNNYLLFILPNMFFAGTIVFALANKFKSTIVSFVGALGIIIAYIIADTLLSDIDNESLASMMDSFGVSSYDIHTRYFTTIEKNTISPSFGGVLLYNRLLWLSIGFVVLFFNYFSFSFKEKRKKVKANTGKEDDIIPKLKEVKVTPEYALKTSWIQFFSLFKISYLNIVKSMVFKVIFLFSLILLITEMIGGFEFYGLQSYPLTYKVVDMISDSSAIFMIIILVFFSGELVWNDRSSHIHEVINATPHNSLASLSSKVLTLLGVVTSIYFLFSLIGICYQLVMGFTKIDVSLYFTTYMYDLLPSYFFYSMVFIFIQVMINQKYQGYFASILLVFVFDIFLSIFDVQSNMINLGSAPSLSYSDMNGFGPGFTGAMWFNTYWSLFGILLLLIAGLFWVRSTGSNFKSRLKTAKKNLNKSYAVKLITVFILWAGTASFVYYNTQVLNPYLTSDEFEEIAVKYEKKHKKYENIALPKVTKVKYNVDIFPYKRDVKVLAEIRIQNKSNQAIDSLHYNLDPDWDVTFTIPNSELIHDDDTLDYKIFKLNKPLAIGDSLDIKIESNYITQGFENGRGSTSIINNGSFLNNRSILPSMGYNSGIELSDKNDRKKHGLAPKDRMPELFEGDSCTNECMTNYLSDGRSDWVEIETIISTSSDQLAIAPGSLLKEWKEGDRNYYHYKVDHASFDFCSFISAKYQVARKKWNGIDLEVYYDEKHDYNIDRMLSAIERSFEYYTKNFGPYHHKQARIIEFPRYATFAQAFPGTMPYSESFGYIINLEDETGNNVIDAVIAHEMAHQWWAHQECGASMQGGTMLTESFAEYSSLMVMKQEKDDLGMKEFLKYDFNRYLRGRSREREKELPLYKVENQSYIHYGKGSVILYALQDYIGEEKVNAALHNFLNEFKYKEPPYPTSLDFIRHLEKEVPDSLQYLIDDWFKEITLYDFRLENADYTTLDDGRYEVNFEIKAKKLRADTIGNETEVQLNDWVDIGVFRDSDEEELLAIKRVEFNGGSQNFSLVVDTIPAKAAIDPKRLLIERVYKDNFKPVKEAE